MTYFVYLETGFASKAATEEEAIKEYRQYLLEMLASGRGDFLVEQED